MEVGKWSSPKDVLTWTVSSTWKRVMQAEELWSEMLENLNSDSLIRHKDESYQRFFHRTVRIVFSRPLLSPDTLRYFHCISNTWSGSTYLSESINCDLSSAYSFLSDANIFLCGGGVEAGQTWSTAYILRRTGEVWKLKDMPASRAFHGVITIQERVYVFAGQTNSNCYFDVLNTSWNILPPLKYSLSKINPCHYTEYIYLPSAQGLFIYDLSVNTWVETSLNIEINNAFAVKWRDGLEIVTNSKSVKWNVQTGECCEERNHANYANVWGNCTPILFRGTAYMPWGQLLLKIDLNSLDCSYFRPTNPNSL